MNIADNFQTDRQAEDRRVQNIALQANVTRGALRASLARGGAPQVLAVGGRYVNGVWKRYERVGDPVGTYGVAP